MRSVTVGTVGLGWLVVLVAAGCGPSSASADGGAKLPALPGTRWQLLSLTEPGEKVTDARNPADVEFLTDGKWGVLHYGGRREAGTYAVDGGRLVMKNEDGTPYHDGKLKWNADTGVLEIDSGKWLMRLRKQKPR